MYKWTATPDINSVSKGYISVRDPATGQWVGKKAETTFFPDYRSKRKTAQEIQSAFENSKRIPNTQRWEGVCSSGLKIQDYYKNLTILGLPLCLFIKVNNR